MTEEKKIDFVSIALKDLYISPEMIEKLKQKSTAPATVECKIIVTEGVNDAGEETISFECPDNATCPTGQDCKFVVGEGVEREKKSGIRIQCECQ